MILSLDSSNSDSCVMPLSCTSCAIVPYICVMLGSMPEHTERSISIGLTGSPLSAAFSACSAAVISGN